MFSYNFVYYTLGGYTDSFALTGSVLKEEREAHGDEKRVCPLPPGLPYVCLFCSEDVFG